MNNQSLARDEEVVFSLVTTPKHTYFYVVSTTRQHSKPRDGRLRKLASNEIGPFPDKKTPEFITSSDIQFISSKTNDMLFAQSII